MKSRIPVLLVVLATCTGVLGATCGCRPLEGPTTEKAKSPVSGASLEATLSADPGPQGPWPDKVGRFSVSFEGTTWYPNELPAGFDLGEVEVTELEPGTGLVCRVAFLKGDQAIVFTQGSRLAREYGIDAVDTLAWGDTWAQVVHEDPADTASRKMIVLDAEDTLCELSGNVDFEVLEAMASSMTEVK